MLALLAACGSTPATVTPATQGRAATAATEAPSAGEASVVMTEMPPAPTTGATSTVAALTVGATEASASAAPSITTALPETGSPAPSVGDYLDDRSTPEALITSYYNAINRKEYARAYGYWQAPGGASDQPPAFPQFQQGYANTASVQLTMGAIGGDVGAGQLYWTVPVVLKARTIAGATQTFAGCYTLHLARPEIQAAPPFHPLGISSAKIQAAPGDAKASDVVGHACQGSDSGQTSPVMPSAMAGSAGIGSSRYLDDRSTAEEVIRSLYNAVNRREYARAYSYWEAPGSASGQPPAFLQFQQGYANTAVVQLVAGTPTGNPGAGQLYYTLPVTLKAQTMAGAAQTFVGCYTLHLARPSIQAAPPFHPLGISSAKLQEVPNDANTDVLMGQSCH